MISFQINSENKDEIGLIKLQYNAVIKTLINLQVIS